MTGGEGKATGGQGRRRHTGQSGGGVRPCVSSAPHSIGRAHLLLLLLIPDVGSSGRPEEEEEEEEGGGGSDGRGSDGRGSNGRGSSRSMLADTRCQ